MFKLAEAIGLLFMLQIVLWLLTLLGLMNQPWNITFAPLLIDLALLSCVFLYIVFFEKTDKETTALIKEANRQTKRKVHDRRVPKSLRREIENA